MGKPLDEYAHNLTVDQLRRDATTLYDTYANSEVVDELRAARAASEAVEEGDRPAAGDMVFENAILMLRDGLIAREFMDAIKRGASHRISLCLKVLSIFYRGSGRPKYAYEMLLLIHLDWTKKSSTD